MTKVKSSTRATSRGRGRVLKFFVPLRDQVDSKDLLDVDAELDVVEDDAIDEDDEVEDAALSEVDAGRLVDALVVHRIRTAGDLVPYVPQVLDRIEEELSSEHVELLVDHLLEELPLSIIAANHDMSISAVERSLEEATELGRGILGDLADELASGALAEVIAFPVRSKRPLAAAA